MNFSRFSALVFMAISSALAVVLNHTIERFTGFNFFSVSVLFVILIGALLLGALAASGFYLGAVVSNHRVGLLDLVLTLAILAVATYSIYYISYYRMTFEDGTPIRNFITFKEFFRIATTTAHHRFGRGATDIGEIGEAGYWLAWVKFGGFIIGGLFVWMAIFVKPICKKCNLYFKKVSEKTWLFYNSNKAIETLQALRAADYDTYQKLLRSPISDEDGSYKIEFTLSHCPACRQKQMKESFFKLANEKWEPVNDLSRVFLLQRK